MKYLWFIALVACGARNGLDDPLTAKWSNNDCHGFGNTSVCQTTLVISADLFISLIVLEIAAPDVGCIARHEARETTWSDGNKRGVTTFTVYDKAKATTEITNCVKPEQNQAKIEDTSLTLPAGDFGYKLDGATLTVFDGVLAGTYTKD